jgi:integrase
LGPWKTRASLAEYDRVINEWLANGRQITSDPETSSRSVLEVVAAYRKFAKTYYVKNGQPTGQLPKIESALKVLHKLYGETPAAEFGPKRLKAVRQKLVDDKLSRVYINDHIGRIKRMFKWAVEEELVPPGIYQALAAVAGLRRGRSKAADRAPIEPVADEVFQATLPYLPPIVADMARLQRLTGMRPTEVCIVRPADVDTSGPVWLYSPSIHKTEHHGRSRIVYLGPKAQAILRPYLLRPAETFCFSPKESEDRRRELAHQARTTPLCCGNRPGTNRRAKPKHQVGRRYNKDSFNRAIARAIDKANGERAKEKLDPLPKWSSNRLRHSAATDIRREFGLEAAQILLGHAKADVTQVYAERDMKKAADVALKIG